MAPSFSGFDGPLGNSAARFRQKLEPYRDLDRPALTSGQLSKRADSEK